MRELFWSLRFRSISSSNGDDLSHCTQMTFPGSIKGRANALSVSSLLILAVEQTNINMRRAHSIFGPLFSLEDHSFIIYSFLHDQLVLEASSWMLNSCSNIHNCFLPFVRLTVQGSLSSWHQSFWNSSIFSSTQLFYSFLKVTGQDNQFALHTNM